MSFSERHPLLAAIGGLMVFLTIALAVAWIFMGNDFFLYKVFAPKYEQTRRQTFEQSRSFNAGMVKDLNSMRAKYVTLKDQSEKDALASVILDTVSAYNINDPAVPSGLRLFIEGLQRERGLSQ